jgi:hypothetical protein
LEEGVLHTTNIPEIEGRGRSLVRPSINKLKVLLETFENPSQNRYSAQLTKCSSIRLHTLKANCKMVYIDTQSTLV